MSGNATLPPLPEWVSLAAKPPAEAVAWFQGRNLLQPTFAWQDMWQEEHGKAFTVAKMARLDLLQTVYDAVERALVEGRSLREFTAELRPVLEKAGWWGKKEMVDPLTGETKLAQLGSPERLQLIYDVNLRTSYSASSWMRIERNKETLPFIVYWTMADERVRASHRVWHALVLPVDHPFWKTHFPPNGWRCRCWAYAIDQAGIDRLRAAGVQISTEAPEVKTMEWVNPRSGAIEQVPVGIDPGWGYNPGQASYPHLATALLDKAASVRPAFGAEAVADAWRTIPGFGQALGEDFAAWTTEVEARKTALGVRRNIGAISPVVLEFLAGLGIETETVAISISDRELLHLRRDAKVTPKLKPGATEPRDIALPTESVMRLPEVLAAPDAVLWDLTAEEPKLLYIFSVPGKDKLGKAVIEVDYATKVRGGDGKRVVIVTNNVKTAGLVNVTTLKDAKKYQVIEGAL